MCVCVCEHQTLFLFQHLVRHILQRNMPNETDDEVCEAKRVDYGEQKSKSYCVFRVRGTTTMHRYTQTKEACVFVSLAL